MKIENCLKDCNNKNNDNDNQIAFNYLILLNFRNLLQEKPLYFTLFGFVINKKRIRNVCVTFALSKFLSLLFESFEQ